MASISHPLAILHKDPRIKEARLSMDTPQVTGHPPQGIFAATQLTGGQALHHNLRGLSGAIQGSQGFCINSSGIETLVEITVQEKGHMSIQVMA